MKKKEEKEEEKHEEKEEEKKLSEAYDVITDQFVAMRKRDNKDKQNNNLSFAAKEHRTRPTGIQFSCSLP